MAVGNCSCKSEYQDQKYGLGRRVVNPVNKTRQGGTTSKNPPREYRCTVCSAIVDQSRVRDQ